MFRWVLDLIRFLRFSRTVTTIPFALGAYVVANKGSGDLTTLAAIMIAIILGALSFLFFNRTYNFPTEYHVPRDRERERLFSNLGLRLSRNLTVVWVGLFIVNAYQLNSTAFYLSPVVLVVMFLYVPSRYFTPFNHFLLGATASFLVLGPYVTVQGKLTPEAGVGGLAVGLWIVGFDVIYSLKNVEKDRAQGFRSIPSEYGTKISLYSARTLHALSMFLFLAYAVLTNLGNIYLVGVLIFCILLIYVHLTLENRGHIGAVRLFFNLNALLSIGFFTVVVLEYFVLSI